MTVLRPPADALTPAFAAVRVRLALVLVLLALAAAGWWWTAARMAGMDEGPWSGLGGLGWFLGVWIVMMAAMMLPSIAPTVALYSRMTRQRSALLPVAFTGGYLVTWATAGVVAFAVAEVAELAGDALAWDAAGRPLAGGTLVVAAAYLGGEDPAVAAVGDLRQRGGPAPARPAGAPVT